MKPLVLVGATGYTGRLVAQALADGPRPFVLAARDPEALAALADTLGGPPTLPGDLSDPAQVQALVAEAGQLLNCVGPFDLWSFPLVEAAARAGVDYLDVTGELPFVARSRAALHAQARASGARVLHSCAFESLLSDLLAVDLAGEDRPARAVRSHYRFARPGMSPGTRLTARLTRGRPRLLVAEGALRGATPEELSRQPDFLGPDQVAVLSPYPEALFFHLALGAREAASYTVVRAGDLGIMLAGAGASPQDPEAVLANHARRRLKGPDAADRATHDWDLTVELETLDGERRLGSLHGVDPYGLTATLLLLASRHLAERDHEGGVLPPSAVVPARAALDELMALGLRRDEKT